jgi:hypothetical protein
MALATPLRDNQYKVPLAQKMIVRAILDLQ